MLGSFALDCASHNNLLKDDNGFVDQALGIEEHLAPQSGATSILRNSIPILYIPSYVADSFESLSDIGAIPPIFCCTIIHSPSSSCSQARVGSRSRKKLFAIIASVYDSPPRCGESRGTGMYTLGSVPYLSMVIRRHPRAGNCDAGAIKAIRRLLCQMLQPSL